MYFLLATGRIVTERDIMRAYEIMYGDDAKDNPMHYNDWVNSLYGIEEVIPSSKMSIQDLIKGDAFMEACKLYMKTYNCTLMEARQAVTEIKTEMENAKRMSKWK